jgi:uncharacterized membrane protein YhiD involved in acid resistance
MANSRLKGKGFTVAVAVIALALGFLLVAALMRGYGSGNATPGGAADPTRSEAQTQQPERAASKGQDAAPPEPAARPSPAAERDSSPLTKVFGDSRVPPQPSQGEPKDWLMTFATVTVRLSLAALLAALLAFRPRRLSYAVKRNPFVAQTQILMAVVASALMMVVGDSAARAFGIFAAASLVRFRTNIKDPKEITVLLVSLAIGLATGVGRWELGLIMAFFVLLLLWGLEYRERDLITRAMELTVKTRNIGTSQDAILQLFRRYDFAAEMRTIDRPDGEGENGCIIYYVDMGQQVSTDRLSEELLAADPRNIDSVQWDQQKNTSYIYQ